MTKRSRKITAAYLIVLVLLFINSISGSANSGPTHWDGKPSAEILVIDEESSIEVLHEDLTFDLSRDTGRNWGMGATVTAEYDMKNTLEEKQMVQMVFPLVANVYDAGEGSAIKVDGEEVPFTVIPGPSFEQGIFDSEGNLEEWDFEGLLTAYSGQYDNIGFMAPEQPCLMYIITPDEASEGDGHRSISVEMSIDSAKSRVIATELSGGHFSQGSVSIEADIDRERPLKMLVIGDPGGVTVDEITADEGGWGYVVERTEGITPRRFFENHLMPRMDYSGKEFMEKSSLYNMAMGFMWEETNHAFGLADAGLLYDILSWERILLLLYEVNFEPMSIQKVSVSYETTATMNSGLYGKNRTHTFNYFLNPASHWKDFGDLDVRIIPGEETGNLIESSLEFTRSDTGILEAHASELPDQDLYFIIQEEKEKEPLKSLPSELQFFGIAFGVFVIAALILFVGVLRKRRL